MEEVGGQVGVEAGLEEEMEEEAMSAFLLLPDLVLSNIARLLDLRSAVALREVCHLTKAHVERDNPVLRALLQLIDRSFSLCRQLDFDTFPKPAPFKESKPTRFTNSGDNPNTEKATEKAPDVQPMDASVDDVSKQDKEEEGVQDVSSESDLGDSEFEPEELMFDDEEYRMLLTEQADPSVLLQSVAQEPEAFDGVSPAPGPSQYELRRTKQTVRIQELLTLDLQLQYLEAEAQTRIHKKKIHSEEYWSTYAPKMSQEALAVARRAQIVYHVRRGTSESPYTGCVIELFNSANESFFIIMGELYAWNPRYEGEEYFLKLLIHTSHSRVAQLLELAEDAMETCLSISRAPSVELCELQLLSDGILKKIGAFLGLNLWKSKMVADFLVKCCDGKPQPGVFKEAERAYGESPTWEKWEDRRPAQQPIVSLESLNSTDCKLVSAIVGRLLCQLRITHALEGTKNFDQIGKEETKQLLSRLTYVRCSFAFFFALGEEIAIAGASTSFSFPNSGKHHGIRGDIVFKSSYRYQEGQEELQYRLTMSNSIDATNEQEIVRLEYTNEEDIIVQRRDDDLLKIAKRQLGLDEEGCSNDSLLLLLLLFGTASVPQYRMSAYCFLPPSLCYPIYSDDYLPNVGFQLPFAMLERLGLIAASEEKGFLSRCK